MDIAVSDEQTLFEQYCTTHDAALLDKIMDTYQYMTTILARRFVGKGLEYEVFFTTGQYDLFRISNRQKFGCTAYLRR